MLHTFILGINDAVDGSYHMPTRTVYDLTGQNIGNITFHYAMSKILLGEQVFHPWHTEPGKLNQMGRVGVMPCANQLGSHSDYGKLAERFSSLNIPLVAVGLGAQGDSQYNELPDVPPGTQNWVRQIAERAPTKAPNIGVRGPFTLKVLERYGFDERAVVTGCPTLFLNPDPELGKSIEDKVRRPWTRIAVASGHQRWRHLAQIEASLARLVEDTFGSYIAQSPLEMVLLARGEGDSLAVGDLEACRDYTRPDLNLEEFKLWSRRYGRVFLSVSEWIEHLRAFDFVVGARIHGVMLGLQAGVPSLCIVHDSRTREMCETMGVPFVMAGSLISGFSLAQLREMYSFDGRAFDANRRSLAGRLNTFLALNRVETSAWFKDLSKT